MQNKSTQSRNQTGSANAGLVKKKVLFANVPADGHFNPLTGLAAHLLSQGYDVRWYTSATYGDKIKSMQIPFYPFKKGLEVTGTNVETVFPGRAKINNKIKRLNFDIINFFTLRGPEYFADIKEIYKTFPFDVMIADCIFSAIPMVKERMGIPVISIGVVPLFETSVNVPPSGLGLMPSHSVAGKLKQAGLRFFAKHFLFKEADKVFRNVMNDYGIDVKDLSLFDAMVKKSSLLLQSGTPGFEYYRSDLGNNIRFIGSLLPHKNNNKRQPWFDNRLNHYERVVLVTQGTVEKDVEKILVPTLEAFKNTQTLVVVTTGGDGTSLLREKYPDDNFIIEDFIPFDDVMPYADVYVSNGGYGGVMLAIENQLPMVVAGVHEGKNEINARIGYFNLGINLNTETPAPAALRAAVETIFAEKIYRENVIRLRQEFAQYDPYKLCEKYVKEILESQVVRHALIAKPVGQKKEAAVFYLY
jgi:MGT family glycosyltransferase